MPQFRLLGPVEVTVGRSAVDVGPVKRRTVLAALLVDAGRPVSVDTLVDRVWDDAPPAKARDVLYAHIARIRRTLADFGDTEVAIERRSGGYVLQVNPERIDLYRFRRLVAQARADDSADAERAERLRAALGLWRATPLADLSGSWAAQVREGLEQQRRGIVALWARTESRLGRSAAVIDHLAELVAVEPLAEALLVELIRALHLQGRTAEALDLYARTRATLLDELGCEPGDELRAIHEAVLRGTVERAVAGPAHGPVPAQLPAEVPGFTGREPELAALTAVAGEAAPAVVLTAVSGTAGVGKTALAVRWAHQARHRFPDGQLYLDLRGYDPEQPVTASTALAGFLGALGVSSREVPLDLDERAARYRTAVSGKRLLVVLDNVSSVEQVRPLLPGTPTCLTLVTSRDTLGGLVAVHGARRIVLDLLPPDDARALLRALIGPRVDAEPSAATQLSTQCGRLPLALRVAAELATARPASSLAELVAELADHRARMKLLDAGGDPRADVRAVFSWSYERLPAAAARTFRLLGLHPGPAIDAPAVAALTGAPLRAAHHDLDLLARAHLIRPAVGGYDQHDLLRAYARAQSDVEDGPEAQEAAVDRLFDHYLAGASGAMDMLYPAERHRRPQVTGPVVEFADPATARDWLDERRPVLLAVGDHAAAHGREQLAGQLASTLYVYLDNGGHSADALTMHSSALAAARRVGDRAAAAEALSHLGIVYWQLGRYPQGFAHLEEALLLFREQRDVVGEARTVGNLGVLCQQTGRYAEAERHHSAALALFAAIGDRVGEANTQTNLGDILMRLGRQEAAIQLLGDALALFRELKHDGGEATALTNLGEAHLSLGRPTEAAGYLAPAAELFAAIGERYGQTCALNGLGEAENQAGHPDAATGHFTAVIALATAIGERAEQARAHVGLATARRADGDRTGALDQLERALALYTALGVAKADDVREALDTW